MLKGLNTLGYGRTEANFPLLTESYLLMWELVRQAGNPACLRGSTYP